MQVDQEMLTDNEEDDDDDEIGAVQTPRPLSEIGM